MRLNLLRRINDARRERRPAILITGLEGGEQRLIEGEPAADDPLVEELTTRLRSGRSGMIERDGRSLFLTVHVPPPRLVAIGAVHISQALVPMARLAGFDMTIIDPRTAFATPERFPDVPLLAEWPEEALREVPLDAFTALAALTHDPKIDDPALKAALEAGCFYVGALGSRKTHARRVERLLEQGLSAVAIERIHAPIGLSIGAQSPAEIAVSVLGEIIATLRQGERRSEAAA